MKNFVVFLVKTVVLFLVFWLLSKLTENSTTLSEMPNWTMWLILAAVAALFDYLVDVIIRKDSPLAGYTQYVIPNRA